MQTPLGTTLIGSVTTNYSYLQNIRPLAATLHSAFLFTCGVVQIELIQIQSVTMSQLDKPYLTS